MLNEESNIFGYSEDCVEVFDFIEAYNLDFNMGNVIFHTVKASRKKGKEATCELMKAHVHIWNEIEHLQERQDDEENE